MARAVWLTDLHLNFAAADRVERLLREIHDCKPDTVLIGGDIAESDTFADALRALAAAVSVPVYFVLGNHDYYGSSIADVRLTAQSLVQETPGLHWLPEAGVVPLSGDAVLIGHGGWGDGRAADFLASRVVLNDYLLIHELREATGFDATRRPGMPLQPSEVLTSGLLAQLQALGNEAANHFSRVLPEAAARGRQIVVLMHVPPFREACWHEGRNSDDQWSPHFTCVAAGDVLAEFMQDHPDHRMTVLCGHTHGEGRCHVLPNLDVLTGGARYGDPRVQRVFEFG